MNRFCFRRERHEICIYWLDYFGELGCFVVQDTKLRSRDGFIVVGKRYDAGVIDGYRDLFSWHGDGGVFVVAAAGIGSGS